MVMPDNPQPTPPDGFALPTPSLLAITGRDALAFAQAQFMSDVARLADGEWQWSGWLNAKGRVIALFALLRLDGETLWLLLPDTDPDAIAAGLQRFVFRSKVTLQRVHAAARAGFARPSSAVGNRSARVGDDVELDMGGDGGPRWLRLSACADAPATPPGAAASDGTEPSHVLAWDQFDLRHGLPRLDATAEPQWTPQQLSLERLGAFSISKGCYPGQEIVARTHFLGQAKRGLMLLDVGVAVSAETDVNVDDRAAGKVVSSRGALALAVLPVGMGSGTLRIGTSEVAVAPLSAGLARNP